MQTKKSYSLPSTKYLDPSLREPSMHQKQVFWQVWFPLLLSLLFVLLLAVLVILSSSNNKLISLYWANISLIYLILITSLFGLIGFVILSFMIYGLGKLQKITPFYSLLTQTYVFRAALVIHQWANKTVQPVLVIRSIWAGFDKLLHILNKLLRRAN